MPTDQVIYVRNAATQAKCTTGQIGDGLPLSGDVNIVGNKALPTFYCGNGNLYVEGTLGGRVTIAAQNNIIVTDDLLLANTPKGQPATGPDMLGLVAGNSVVVYHPVNSERQRPGLRSATAGSTARSRPCSTASGCRTTTRAAKRRHAARARLDRPEAGAASSGTRARGTGYLKDYGYDTRLKFTSPPYFPQWTNAVWRRQTTAELKPAY